MGKLTGKCITSLFIHHSAASRYSHGFSFTEFNTFLPFYFSDHYSPQNLILLMMASLNILKDVAENCFKCPVCVTQFTDPKQLPIHRYCCDCLKTIIKKTPMEKIECPMCQQRCDVPQNGINGFKTDFHALKFIQWQTPSRGKNYIFVCVAQIHKKSQHIVLSVRISSVMSITKVTSAVKC